MQLAITTYLFWPSGNIAAGEGPLLGNIAADQITAVTITDNSGRSVSFAQADGQWALANTDGYPARSEKITEILGKLLAINTDRPVTQTSGSHDRLQVTENNFQRKVDITTASGTQTLYFGSTAGASATHVRSASQDATYLTNQLATWELDTITTSWIDVAYFQVPKGEITEVILENEHGTLSFVPNGDEWTLSDATTDEPIASANISTFIDRVANLNLSSVVGKNELPEYDFANPLATLTVTSLATTTDTTDTAAAEATVTTIVVGAKDEANNAYYVKSSASDYYIRLAAFTGDEFVNSQRSNFMLESPEATTPETTGNEVITDTSTLTDTEAITETPAVTETSAITTSSEITESESLTTTETLTETDTLTDTDPIISTDELTATENLTSENTTEDE